MNKRSILVIILLTSVALGGIVFTQYSWIKKALYIFDDQFNHRGILALQKSRDILAEKLNSSGDYCNLLEQISAGKPVETSAFESLIDSIIKMELHYMNIEQGYRYALIDEPTQHLLLGNYKGYEEALLKTTFRFTLSCQTESGDYILALYFPNKRLLFPGQLVLWMSITAIFLLVIIAVFYFTLISIIRQKRLSDMKNDFINNMTHEFKTPIATISIASEMLMKAHVFNNEEKTLKYARIIYDENVRMMHQVEQVLQIALIDKEKFKIKPEDVDLHKVIKSCVQSSELAVMKRGGEIQMRLEAINDHLIADSIHMANVITNLLDNANKYIPDTPLISISTHNVSDGIMLSIEDNGIGISKENQRLVFKKFFRVSTGNIHDVKGFGLGLFYVKTIIDAHGGFISIFSEPNKGTRIEVFLPFINNLD